MNKISKDNLFTLTFFSVVIEALITYFNKIFVTQDMCWEISMSIVVGMLIAIAYKIDVFAYFGFKSKIPFVGNIITGILMSRGSNYIFDLITKLTK